MTEPNSSPEVQKARQEARRESIAETIKEAIRTVTDTIKDEREFHQTGIRHEPGSISVESVATGALGSAVNYIGGLAKDELEYRATGHRPDHDSLEALQAREAGKPLRGALAHTLTWEELGVDPDTPLLPFHPGTDGKAK